MTYADVTFPSMGSQTRLVIDGAAPDRYRAFLLAFERALTRFDPESELCAFNRDTRAVVPAGALLRRAVAAGVWAAERSGGLVDPTLLEPLVAAGYDRSRRAPELALADALREAPRRAPAAPDPAARWRGFATDDAAGTIRRPAGVGFDTGGIGKGLAADLVAAGLKGTRSFAVDCGGDVRTGGAEPFPIEVRHPITGEVAHELLLADGAIATSGIDVRLWRGRDGRPAHHLLDPSTGRPAWTGLVGATALAPSALEAETLSKAALLSGPGRAARLLARYGGLVVRDDGDVLTFGPMRPRPVVRLAGAAA